MGDATNFVVVFAGELLQQAEYLLRMGLHPSEVTLGYELAAKKAQELINELTVYKVTDPTDAVQLLPAVRSAISSKQYGYEDMLAKLVIDASLEVMPKSKPSNFNTDSGELTVVLSVRSHSVSPRCQNSWWFYFGFERRSWYGLWQRA